MGSELSGGLCSVPVSEGQQRKSREHEERPWERRGCWLEWEKKAEFPYRQRKNRELKTKQ